MLRVCSWLPTKYKKHANVTIAGLLTVQILQSVVDIGCLGRKAKVAVLFISGNFVNERFLGAGMTCLKQAGVHMPRLGGLPFDFNSFSSCAYVVLRTRLFLIMPFHQLGMRSA